MDNKTHMGMNRTGMGTSPILGPEMIASSNEGVPSTTAEVDGLTAVRESYAREVTPVGSVPPPPTLRGMAATAIDAIKGNKPIVLIDKLAERLAFERSGSRLWQGLLSKFDVYGTWQGGPTRAEIEAICAEEAGHFAMLHKAIVGLGADPTVMTPSADLAGVESMGVVQVISDPRTNLAQSLHAILIAELVDNDAWAMLIDLTSLEHAELAASFQGARDAEARHLTLVRSWLVSHGRLEARGDLTAAA